MSCNLNNAACKLKLKQNKEAEKLCTKVAEVDSYNFKALYRRAQAYINLVELELSEKDINKALELDPGNRDVKSLYKVLNDKVKEYNWKDAQFCGNIIAKMRKLEQEQQKTEGDKQGVVMKVIDNWIHIPLYDVNDILVSTRPRESLERAISAIGNEGVFNVIVATEDVYRGKPDPEMLVYATQLLHFIPERCIVFGNSNQTVEATRDARMKCVAVASKHPVYELSAADRVVKRLNELSVVDLKNLAAIEF